MVAEIKSIRQTMPEFEVLLIKDCTPDGAMQIACEYAQLDPRFRILEHEVNQGLGSARNTVMKAASGKYFTFLDSDDRLPADAIEVLLRLAESNQANMAIGNMAWINNQHLTPVSYIDRRIQTWPKLPNTNLRIFPVEMCLLGSVCNRLIKSSIVKEHGLMFPEQVYYEDIPFSLALWFHSANIVSTSRFVYYRVFRNDPNNLSLTQTFNKKALLDRDIVAQMVFNFTRVHAISSESATRLRRIALLSMLGTSKDMLSSLDQSWNMKVRIQWIWFSLHVLRINRMIRQLNSLSPQRKIANIAMDRSKPVQPSFR